MYPALPTEETIAAVCTAIAGGEGGIAVVRISGSLALQVGKSVVNIPGNQTWSSHKVLYGHVIDKESQKNIDEVLVLIMHGPRSFTGEDVVEIHCHGGLICVKEVLAQVLKHPKVRRALPGEFSQRAVLNGRLDLTQAESINELIAARTQKAARLAMAGLDGHIHKKITDVRDKLLDQLSEIEARVDFEDELPLLSEKKLLNELTAIRLTLEGLIIQSQKASLIRNGLKIALVGLPNVGKSSLLNLLSKRERAIVTDLPGTTRDFLESEIILDGIPITLVDTAGIRETTNEIEKLGIERSQKTLNNSDAVLLIFDVSIGWTTEDQDLLNQIPEETPRLLVGNKTDLKKISNVLQGDITISALTGEGEDRLVKAILNLCGATDLQGIELALNERQQDLVKMAKDSLLKTEEAANQKLPWDFWTIDLRDAIYKLGELTGDEVTEAILDRIFSRFCIGK